MFTKFSQKKDGSTPYPLNDEEKNTSEHFDEKSGALNSSFVENLLAFIQLYLPKKPSLDSTNDFTIQPANNSEDDESSNLIKKNASSKFDNADIIKKIQSVSTGENRYVFILKLTQVLFCLSPKENKD